MRAKRECFLISIFRQKRNLSKNFVFQFNLSQNDSITNICSSIVERCSAKSDGLMFDSVCFLVS